MQFQLLGPFRVLDRAGSEIVFDRRRDRCLLALLLLEPGRVVQVDRLIELLWDGEPPAMAKRAVHAHAARVRKAMLAAFGVPLIQTSGAGYLVDVPPETIDVQLFRELTEAADFRKALDLVRGPLLADVASDQLRERIGLDLGERVIAALEGWLETELQQGRHQERLPDIARACAEHPDSERLAAAHMLALYRCGRTKPATEMYAAFRRRLVGKTGLEPGAALSQLHTAILRADPSLEVNRPAQALPTVDGFTGRATELAALEAIYASNVPYPRLAGVHGVGGVGKTSLALHWAQGKSFPDGVHYVDVGSLGPLETVADLTLALLGHSAMRLPSEPALKREQYRKLVVGRRLLILDNVPDTAHARALLPSDPQTMVIVISRHSLEGLAVHEHAAPLAVAPLDLDDAVELLRTTLEGSPGEQLTQLARLCDGLPLALRIAGCRAAANGPGALEFLLYDLAVEERRLTALEIDGFDSGVRAVFDDSYRALQEPEAMLFRRIGLLPMPAFDVPVAACLGGITEPEAFRLLTALTRNQLLLRDGPGGYRMHDLVRLFAQERAAADEDPGELERAVHAVACWYLDVALASYPLLSPRRPELSDPDIPYPPQRPLRFSTRQEAVAWFDAERRNVAAVVREMVSRKWHRQAWQLTGGLFSFYNQRRLWADWFELNQRALESALADDDPHGLVRVYNGLGASSKQLGRNPEAIRYYSLGLEAAESTGNPVATGALLVNLGSAHTAAGKLDVSFRYLQKALALKGFGDDPPNAGLILLNLSHLEYQQRHFAEAIAYSERGLVEAQKSGDRHTFVYLHHGNGDIRLQLGDYVGAADCAQKELALATELGDPMRQAYALDLLATARHLLGAHDEAVELWKQSREVCIALQHPLATDIDDVLEGRCPDLIERRFAVNLMP